MAEINGVARRSRSRRRTYITIFINQRRNSEFLVSQIERPNLLGIVMLSARERIFPGVVEESGFRSQIIELCCPMEFRLLILITDLPFFYLLRGLVGKKKVSNLQRDRSFEFIYTEAFKEKVLK